MRRVPRHKTAGFTLIELMVVMVIMGIIIAFITTAAMDGVRRAEERGTQALITKLEAGVSDRLDALMNSRPLINDAHRALASIYVPDPRGGTIPLAIAGEQRAAAISLIDYLRSELPDVFYIQRDLNGNPFRPGTADTPESNYPLNFAAAPYPNPMTPNASAAGVLNEMLLPMGHALPKRNSSGLLLGDWQNVENNSDFDPSEGLPAGGTINRTGSTGIFGASYSAQAGIKKNLGLLAAGYDGADNNGNRLIDEWEEGTNGLQTEQLNEISARLSAHTHKTARSEMLYALLVEGVGPLGSVFSADEFRDTEVKDTDGDGLPEFVDAWGEPLQFFRWPVMYYSDSSSEVQKGYTFYSQTETRQFDPLDPNQNLVAPAWWSAGTNTDAPNFFLGLPADARWAMSGPAATFQGSFYSLMDPRGAEFPVEVGGTGRLWDRSGTSGRRAFYSKFLILSSGPDRVPGVFQIENAAGLSATNLTLFENQASPFAYDDRGPATQPQVRPAITSSTASAAIQAGKDDDITNHNIQSAGTGVR